MDVIAECVGARRTVLSCSSAIPIDLGQPPAAHLSRHLSLKQHTPYSAEVYVMAVLQEAHRKGIGRTLISSAEDWLKSRGVQYLQVKTLGPSDPDEGYATTRSFYEAVGFKPLEEFKQIWDEDNPCLIMIKKL